LPSITIKVNFCVLRKAAYAKSVYRFKLIQQLNENRKREKSGVENKLFMFAAL